MLDVRCSNLTGAVVFMDRIELEPIARPLWGVPTRSHVIFAGHQTDLILSGSILLSQHETHNGFLVFVTYEGPPDGVLLIYLISPGITKLDACKLGSLPEEKGPRDFTIVGNDVFEFTFGEDNNRWRLTVLKEPVLKIESEEEEWNRYRYLELEMLWKILYGMKFDASDNLRI